VERRALVHLDCVIDDDLIGTFRRSYFVTADHGHSTAFKAKCHERNRFHSSMSIYCFLLAVQIDELLVHRLHLESVIDDDFIMLVFGT
jgi:hypothetical protein